MATLEGTLRIASLEDDLRHPTNCNSALLELELAAHLKRNGHHVELRPRLPNGKESDLVCDKNGQIVYVELKRMRESQRQIALNQLGYLVAFAMPEIRKHIPGGDEVKSNYRIVLSDRLASRLSGYPEHNERQCSQIITELKAAILTTLKSGLPLQLKIPEIAEVSIGQVKDSESGIIGPNIPPIDELIRFVRGHLRDAIHQLHPSHPGIIILQTPAFIHRAQAELALRELLKLNAHLVRHVFAIVFFPVYYSLPRTWSLFDPFVIVNPTSQYSRQDIFLIQDLRELLEQDLSSPLDE